jgi:hypothetical protein
VEEVQAFLQVAVEVVHWALWLSMVHQVVVVVGPSMLVVVEVGV